jgi:hypothetical protein
MKNLYTFLMGAFLASTAFAQIPVIDVCTTNGFLEEWLDFEGQNDNLIVLDTAAGNLWEIGESNKAVLNSGTGDNVLITDKTNTYPINNTSRFEFAVLNCDESTAWGGAGYYGQTIMFFCEYDTDAGLDGGMIEVKHGINSTYTNILNDTTSNLHLQGLYAATDTVEALQEPGFSGATPAGIYIDYPPFLNGGNGPDTIYFRMTFKSDSIDTGKDGWMFSDMGVKAFFWSIDELSKQQALSIFPNPASTTIQVEAEGLQHGTVQVFDLTGKRLLEQPFTGSPIDISTLAPGNYVVRCFNLNSMAYGRFVRE